jgi:hypothetical protein
LIRPAPKNLHDTFRTSVIRRVAKDHTVSLNGKLYEALVGLIGKSVRLLYHEKDLQRIEVICEEQSHGFLVALNPQINSRVRRNSSKETELIQAPQNIAEPPDRDDERYRGGRLFEGEKQA